MGAITVVLNHAGVRDLLRSDEVEADLRRRAEAIAAAAGDGYEVEMFRGQNRWRATVRTGTETARRDEAKNRTLTGAIDAGR